MAEDSDHNLLQDRCVNMIARLFNAPIGDGKQAIGAGTVGSSEAIMLAGLAFKRKWQNARKAAGLPYDKPNLVTGANVQVWPFSLDLISSLRTFHAGGSPFTGLLPASSLQLW